MIEAARGAWITVEQATVISKRSLRTIYRWVDRQKIRSQVGPDGVTRVWGSDVLEAESTTRRGRPRK